MTVVLNPAGLAALFESPPVVAFVRHQAELVKAEAQRNVRGYFGTAASLHGRVDEEIDVEMEGNRAIVGIKDGGSKSKRLVQYQIDGSFPWLTRALEASKH